MIIPSFLWYNVIGLICCSADLVLGICRFSQNYLASFCWASSILLCLLATMVPVRFVFYCLGMFSSPIQSCFANKLCFIVPFVNKNSPLLGLKLVCCSDYLFQKAGLSPRVLILLRTCLFLMGIMLFLPVLTS